MRMSALELDSLNKKVLDDRDKFLNGVLYADETTGVCLIDSKAAQMPGEPRVCQFSGPFHVVDIRDGSAGKPHISELFKTCETVCVLGGSPNACAELERSGLESGDTTILAVNHYHEADYSVFCDRGAVDFLPRERNLVSIWGDLSDYAMDARETGVWFHSSSSFTALWLAGNIAREKVVLLGFDLPPDSHCKTTEQHLVAWSLAKRYLPTDIKFYAKKGGPLAEIFDSIDLF